MKKRKVLDLLKSDLPFFFFNINYILMHNINGANVCIIKGSDLQGLWNNNLMLPNYVVTVSLIYMCKIKWKPP